MSTCKNYSTNFKAVKRFQEKKQFFCLFSIFFDFFLKNHVSRPLPLTKSLNWHELQPVEIEAGVIDIGHGEDMAAGLQRDEQRAAIRKSEPDVPPVVLRVRPAARAGQEE